MDCDELDRLIREAEADLLANNTLARLSEGERKALYAPVPPAPRTGTAKSAKLPASRYRTVSRAALVGAVPTAAATGLARELCEAAGSPVYLTQQPEADVLPSDADECRLAAEYALEKALQAADRIVMEDASEGEDGGGGSSAHAPDRGPVTLQALRLRAEYRLDTAYRAELYELARARAAVSGDPRTAAAPEAGPASRLKGLQSVLPGPYLSLTTQGRYTHYEALVQRLPLHRSIASTTAALGGCGVGRRRSKHYPVARPPVPPSSATPRCGEEGGRPSGDGREDTHPTSSAHLSSLSRWKRSMGLAM